MKKKIVIILVVMAVIAGMVIGVIAQPYRIVPAKIKDVGISCRESFPPQYYLRVVAGGPNSCWKPWKYNVMRFGNVIFVKILTLRYPHENCGLQPSFFWEEKIIPLGSCFIQGMKYIVVVNDVVETFRWEM